MQVNKQALSEQEENSKKFKELVEDDETNAAVAAALKFNSDDKKEHHQHDSAIDSELLTRRVSNPSEQPNSNHQYSSAYQHLLRQSQQQSAEKQHEIAAATFHQSPQGSQGEESHTERNATGPDDWQKARKANHKEVERRRRVNINQAIDELASVLPTQETNKATILKRAAEYIRRLKENENNNIEKWTLEKLITDQAVNELSNSNEKLKIELEKAYREVEHWKQHYLSREAK